ncbi:endonuclease/exonuclease/phosphatase family protein [Daejeonella sp.]|uniref:endonuclease/exonuclease/phosphatase family protein n=1 Tax=Daejeonella sp. TaxID=2805397 RepID=UPI0030BA6F44
MPEKLNLSRRTFVKGLGLAASTPWLAQSVYAGGITSPAGASNHKVVTANIRVALAEDDAKGLGWNDRKDFCIKVLKAQKADIIGLQEVLKVQAEDLKKAFPDFMLLGFDGPEMDAHQTGYHGIAKNPIMFRKSRYELNGAGTYWLSNEPNIGGSMAWETARARHANYLRLKDRKTGVEFRVVNTHLDHITQAAREKQIEAILKECAQYPEDFIQILTGDFNAGVANAVGAMLKKDGWQDSYAAVHGDKDPGFTGHGFEGEAFARSNRKIDFIFSKGNVKALASKIIKDSLKGKYPSDHYFVSADLSF